VVIVLARNDVKVRHHALQTMNEEFLLCELLSCKNVSLFGNKIWIVGCTRLPKPSMYSLAVIQPRKAMLRPTQYMHDTAGKPGIPDCRLTSEGVLQTQTLSYARNSMKDHESCHHIMRSQLCDVQVLWM
jgi:hypothetical protein